MPSRVKLFTRQLVILVFLTVSAIMLSQHMVSETEAAQGKKCTESRLSEYEQRVESFVNDNPDHQAAVVHMIAEIESEYGGEVPLAKQCEVFAKVMKILTGAEKRPRPIKR